MVGSRTFGPLLFKLLMYMCVGGESESRSVMFDSATPWTIQSMKFSRPEYWSGQPFPSPGIKPRSLSLQADSLPAELPGKPNLVKIQLDLGIWSGT